MSFLIQSTTCGPVELKIPTNEHSASLRTISKRSPTVNDRPGCQANAQPPPPNRQNTTEQLLNLRKQMVLFNVDAYIITSDNAHQVIKILSVIEVHCLIIIEISHFKNKSEMVSPYDHRREFISGFTVSAG